MSSDRKLDNVNWELTYACQLRCSHCCTESGRRASEKLPREALLRITDTLIQGGVRSVQFTGGEPLLVPELFEIAERLQAGGVDRHLFTNGIDITEDNVRDVARLFPHVHVSVDGPRAGLHDPIRGRAGSFDAAMRALHILDAESRRRGEEGSPFGFGIDVVVLQSNYDELEIFCREIAPKFPAMRFLVFGAGIPSGLAARESYAEKELLTDAQLAEFRTRAFAERMQAAAPPKVHVEVLDNFYFQMHPDLVKKGYAMTESLEIGPDGGVRGMIIYEGVVGNILEDSLDTLFKRTQERFVDPFFLELITPAKTMRAWAAAVRRLDVHYGTESDRRRIGKRTEHVDHLGSKTAPLRRLPQLREARDVSDVSEESP